MRRWTALCLDIAVKVALIALLLHAIANPDLPRYSGKAMLGRALTFPIAASLVPALWWLRFRERPFPAIVDPLFTAPFAIDVVGNALGLYDSIDWWDDANHFFNWMLVTAAAALVLRSTGLGRLTRFGLATAYTDTLGDLTMGTLGGALGAAIVGFDGGSSRSTRSGR